ncbi:hypothetical protein CL656_01945 [bacterium]|nr:hypothetical protein [bacterium]|tara:strand:+ start:1248 stop:1994 length:747 start_codon:yes stop_codon:yes gene_type:complete
MKPKINFFKKLLKTITLLTVIISLNFSIIKNVAGAREQTARESESRIEIEEWRSECNNININKPEYEEMKTVIQTYEDSLENFITFLDQPLSTKNNVFIKQTCVPETTVTSSKYKCKSKVTCTCTPQFPKIRGSDQEKKGISCRRVQFIIYKSGQELAAKYVNLIYRWVSSIVGIVAVIYIIVNAIIISSAQNDSGQVTAAKDRIMQSLIALVVLLSASIILYAINPTFFTVDRELQSPATQTQNNQR